jgi:AAA domain/Bifunctional DNA primase/polymerase, N-terminal
MVNGADVYDSHRTKLIELGYFPLPIGPGTKKPQSYVPSEKRFTGIFQWTHPGLNPILTPQPGAGIGLRCGKQPSGIYVCSTDCDDEDVALAMIGAFPGIEITKFGARGFTFFHKSGVPVPSRDFRIGDRVVLQVLSDGKQTVLPPSLHPDTGKPYAWSGARTLYDIRPENLPQLPANYVELIENILRPFGYVPEAEKPEPTEPEEVKANSSSDNYDSNYDNPFYALNQQALSNLPAWVPALDLYGCRQQPGRYTSYVAVAAWRPSTQGRPLEQRDRNLKITSKGIKDFGNGETFSALDLVMRAHGCDRGTAYAWLEGRLNGPGPVDYDSFKEGERTSEEAGGASGREGIVTIREFTDNFTPPDYLWDGIVQVRFAYSLTGVTGEGKTSILLLLAAHVAQGKPLHGRDVKKGAVLFLAGENPDDIRMRVIALAGILDFDLKTTPVYFLPGTMPIREAVTRATVYAKRESCEFALVIVDTSAAYFQGTDENNNVQAGGHARDIREFTKLPGGPCVIVSCHPTKAADRYNLLPRGGGAYVAEVDGNLFCRRTGEEGISEIHWVGKHRGANFDPLFFEIKEGVTNPRLVDSRGRLIPTVVAQPIADREHYKKRAASREQEDAVLIVLYKMDEDDAASIAQVALRCGWLNKKGEADKPRAQRVLDRLRDANLVKLERGDWLLTDTGKKQAEKVLRRRQSADNF